MHYNRVKLPDCPSIPSFPSFSSSSSFDVQLQKQQQQERHRQSGHTAATEDANNHVVVYSLVETVAFVGAACFQLFFIRNWFEGKVGSNNKGRQWA